MRAKIRRGLIKVRLAIYDVFHAKKPKIALVSCREWRGKVLDDLLIARAFNRSGYRVKIVAWEDSGVDYDGFKAILVTSMWGYQDRLVDLEKWFKVVENKAILNPIETIRANYDKPKQKELLDRVGIRTIPTEVIKKSLGSKNREVLTKRIKKIAANFGVESVVIKPAISGSGKNTFIIGAEKRKYSFDFEDIPERILKINQEKDLLVQPFIKEIDNGELAVIMIDGEFSHAVMRYPHIFNTVGINHEVKKVDNEVIEICKKILEISEFKHALYSRIDFVKIKGEYYAMEVELFEPQLYYHLIDEKDEKLNNFVDKFIRRIK